MSFSDQIAADVTAVFLDTDGGFAVTVTRYPAGDKTSPEPVDAVFAEGEPRIDTSRGSEVVRTGILHFASTQATDSRDKWLIGGVEWQARQWGQDDEPLDDPGMGNAYVERREFERRTTSGGKLV